MASEKTVKRLQYEYWRKLNVVLIDDYPDFKPKMVKGNAYYLPLGNKFARISMSVNSIKKIQECKIIISHKQGLYNYLEQNKEQIENMVGIKLNWECKSDGNSYIGLFKYFDIVDEENWDDAIKWHLDIASMLFTEFSIWISMY
ncbi:DUF4268 domain-containing protein [Methanobrevibacter sp.]|uniref:DUF4268 domain-containing protein n=1 Tax=Methanobrevibacter sp. TaxID=66852 RepID=UPI0026E0F39B|nr:DUF4268 domain-containing protein [Methanobrevibacter sp.]MDO5859574.1 DUF4268 domain-containing protein [Methanobrevibacter sp.]